MLEQLRQDLQKHGNPEKAEIMQRFFKTGPGQYGEGDVFIGVKVPEQRAVARRYLNLSLNEIEKLLNDKIHEYRLTGLFLLINKYKKADDKTKKEIFNFYLKNTKNINNWDLVDVSAEHIIGEFLHNKNRDLLYQLARSKDLWERRIAMLSCFSYIKKNQFEDALRIADMLLDDKHDLIHKAAGWMLREIGKRDLAVEEEFLKRHCKSMPRTMLRYAIERFDDRKRAEYLRK